MRAADFDALLEKGAAAVRAPACRRRRAAMCHHAAARARALASRMRVTALTATPPTRLRSQWDKAEPKPIIAAYGVGLLVGLYFVESFIHLPVLNLVIGFPLELLGVVSAGALALRYLKQGGDIEADVNGIAATLKDTLPGLKQ